MPKDRKGFTLIELLVVISIIGLLSSIILSALNSARSKGANSAVKANLVNIRPQAELIYDTTSPNSYATICTDSLVLRMRTAAEQVGGGTSECYADADSWVTNTPLKVSESANSYWCVDSAGKSKAITSGQAGSGIINANTLCP